MKAVRASGAQAFLRINNKGENKMQFSQLQSDMIAALKAGDKQKREGISLIVAAIKKAAIDAGLRNEISDELVDQVLLKELKSVQEQIDTCPASRTDLLEQYKYQFGIISEYAPKLMGEEDIMKVLNEKFADVLASKNKGLIMKTVMPEFKGKADGKLISQIIAKICV